jgi:hypothetical protein
MNGPTCNQPTFDVHSVIPARGPNARTLRLGARWVRQARDRGARDALSVRRTGWRVRQENGRFSDSPPAGLAEAG